MAAEVLSAAGLAVTVFERMPSVGRKLLMAGRGGLNLTHAEPFEAFAARYGEASPRLRPLLEAFPPSALVAWAEGLGQATFVGASGRVFPRAMKASPLLRAWLARLEAQGVEIRTRRTWRGWTEAGDLAFDGPDGAAEIVRPRATILALGGASWPRLGSDAAWVPALEAAGAAVRPFRPANCGFDVGWSEVFRARFQGHPLKGVGLRFGEASARGDLVVTAYGLEGGAIYALGARLREAIDAHGRAELLLDLRPDMDEADLARRLARPRGGQSLANHLRRALNLPPVAVNLLREAQGVALPADPAALAVLVKRVPIALAGVQPLARAISSAGGVAWDALDERLALTSRPDVFLAGEMLDWEAPTGGYLLQAAFATGVGAAKAALAALHG